MRRLARIGKKAVRFDLYVRVFSLDISNSGTDLEGVYVELVRGGRNDRTKEHKFDSSMWTGDEPLSVPVTLYKDMKRGCFQTKPFTLNLRSSQDDSSLSIYTLDAAQFANALDGVGNTSTRTLKLSAVKGKSKLKNVQLTVTVGCVFKSEPTGDGETSTVMTGTSTMLDEQDLSGFEESDLSTTIQEFDDENDGLDGTFDGENGAFDTLLEDVDKLLTPDRRKSEPRMGVGATMEDEIVGDLVASDEDRTSLQEKYQKSVSEVTSSSPSEALQQGRSEALESAEDAIALLQALEANEDRRVDGGPTPMITADSETDDTIRAISENMVAETSTIMEGLRSDISLAISKRQEDSDRHSKVLGELSVAKAIIKELREALNTSETLKASAKEEIDDLRKQLQAAEGDSLQAAEAANMAIDTMNSMEMKYQAAKDATESAEARASAAEKAREGSDTAASQAKAVMRLELESALRALQEAKAEAEEAVASANAEAEEAATAQEMAASAAEDVASAAATRIGELEAEITKLREEMNKVHDLSKIAVEEAEAKAEDAVAKTTLAALADASASGERMTSLQEQLTSQKTENQEMSKKLAEMEQVNNTMHADLKAARAEALKGAEAANNASTIVHDLEMQINAAEARAAAAETATQAKEWQMVKLASEATTAAEAAQKSELGMRAATEAAQAQANEAIAKVKAEADEAVEAAAAAAAASSSPSIEATQMTETWRKRALEAEQKCSSLDRRIEYLQSELQHNHDNFAMRARNDDILGEDEANDTSADSKSLTRKATQLLETTQMRLCAALESLGDSGAKAVQLSVEAAAEDLKNGTTTATAIEGAATMIDELLELLIADVKRRTALMPVNTTDGGKKTSHTATESNPGTSNFEESVKEQLEVARRTTELEMAVENGRREVLRLQALLGTARADADAAEVASEEFATELDALKTEIFKADLEKSEELAKLRASHLSEVALLTAEVEKLSIQVNIDDNIESNISNSPNSTTGEASSTFDDRHTRSGINALRQKLAESSKAIKNDASHLQSMQKYSENLREEISGKVRCLACSEFIDLNSTKEHYCIAARRQSDPEILKARAAAQIAATAAKTNSKPADPLKASSFLSSLKAKRSSFFK